MEIASGISERKKKFKLDEIPGEREAHVLFHLSKRTELPERVLESILWELVLEQESQLPHLSYNECIAEELRGCSLTVFSSDCFIFFFFFFSFGLCCSKGMF